MFLLCLQIKSRNEEFVIIYLTEGKKKESDRTVLLIYGQPTYLYFYIIPEQTLCFSVIPGNRI